MTETQTIARPAAPRRGRITDPAPRCLHSFTLDAAANVDAFPAPAAGRRRAEYRLVCSCGHDRFYVFGSAAANADGSPALSAPLSVACAACYRTLGLIGPEFFGPVAQWRRSDAATSAGRANVASACGACGVQPMGVEVAFEYDERADAEPDGFSRFVLVGRCDRCAHALQITDVERGANVG